LEANTQTIYPTYFGGLDQKVSDTGIRHNSRP